ncbi:uncharacterized protein ACWYII_004803 [Salvelinus alpinus]
MMLLESCLAMQSWVNREYRRVLSTHPWGAPVLRISVTDVLLPTLTTWGRPVRKSRIQLQREVFSRATETEYSKDLQSFLTNYLPEHKEVNLLSNGTLEQHIKNHVVSCQQAVEGCNGQIKCNKAV